LYVNGRHAMLHPVPLVYDEWIVLCFNPPEYAFVINIKASWIMLAVGPPSRQPPKGDTAGVSLKCDPAVKHGEIADELLPSVHGNSL
jgi:hypothetical protein